MYNSKIKRRDFLKIISLMSIVPSPVRFLEDIYPKPYWLKVLSEGADYSHFNPNVVEYIADEPQNIRNLAYEVVRYGAWKKYNDLHTGIIEKNDHNMDSLIYDYKFSQFLLDNITEEYVYCDDFPKVTHDSDPFMSTIFYDLSTIILEEIKELPYRYISFDKFDIKLLNSSLSYTFSSIETTKKALEIAPRGYYDMLNTQLGRSYIIAGQGFEHIGDKKKAIRYYDMAHNVIPKDIIFEPFFLKKRMELY